MFGWRRLEEVIDQDRVEFGYWKDATRMHVIGMNISPRCTVFNVAMRHPPRSYIHVHVL